MPKQILVIGDLVEMTPAALNLELNRAFGRTGRIVMVNRASGTVTVRGDGVKQVGVYLEQFWRKRLESARNGA